MKTKLLLFTIAVTVWFSSQLSLAQDVFPKSGAIWVIERFGSSHLLNELRYGLSGDTIINKLTYQKLYLLNDSTLNIDHEDIYIAGIRQVNKQVRIKPAGKKNEDYFDEYMLYDFSRAIGDEIVLKNYLNIRPSTDYFTFEEMELHGYIDVKDVTLLVEKDEITPLGRLLTLRSYFNDNYLWLEGVGSLSGLFFPPFSYSSYGADGFKLRCMKQDEKVKYLREDCDTCFGDDEPRSIENKDIEQLFVYFNTTKKDIEYKVVSTDTRLLFRLHSIDGVPIITKRLDEQQGIISVSHIPKGTYIYNFVGNDVNKSNKIIIR